MAERRWDMEHIFVGSLQYAEVTMLLQHKVVQRCGVIDP